MSNEKQQILDLIQNRPKHYSKMVKNNPHLWDWVEKHSTCTNDSVPAQIFSAITGTSDRCPNGKLFNYRGPSIGWGGCGPHSVCKCITDSTAHKVKNKKANRTLEQIERENKKRENTNIKKYGVNNTGKISKSKENHKKFYQDSEKVAMATAKQESTMLSLYGVTNVAQIESVKEQKRITNIERYGFENPMQNPEVAERSSLKRKENFDPDSLIKLNYEKFKERCRSVWGVEALISQDEYNGVYPLPKMTFRCLSCKHEETRTLDYRRIPICKICNPTEVNYESNEEVEVRTFVESIYDGPMRIRDRSTINPFELDIVLPDLGLAIEYCGLYWHSENASGKSWNYHEKKMLLANARGLRLITIFSDEWKNKNIITKSKLASIILTNQSSIGARKCSVKFITRDLALDFHNTYHIQGSPRKLKINVGLFNETHLLAVATFNLNNNEMTLSRYSSCKRVVGGCSRAIKFLTSNIDVSEIVSFADLRWSQGDMYIKMGFTEISRVPPMQSYVGKGYSARYDKRAFPKRKINPDNSDKSEWQIMQELGYDRIWDCGKIKYKLIVNPSKK